jgi:hypothetical protein
MGNEEFDHRRGQKVLPDRTRIKRGDRPVARAAHFMTR